MNASHPSPGGESSKSSECNCKADIEAKLTERFKTSEPALSNHGAELAGYGLVIAGNAMVVRGYMPVDVTANRTRKDGSVTLKKVRQNMFFTYCPFCGQKIPGASS